MEKMSQIKAANTLFINAMGRDADIGGLNYCLGQLNNGTETRNEVLLGFINHLRKKDFFLND